MASSPSADTLQDLVARQFGARARAYVESAVHARGEDLDQLARLAERERPTRCLDLGCGGGHVSFTVAPYAGEVVAYDLSAQMLAEVKEEAARRGLSNISTRQGAVEDLPFADGSFDMVASRYSGHHWSDLPKALGAARRVLKDGGRAVFMDVAGAAQPLLDTFLQTIEMLRDPSHVRDYGVREWRAYVEAAGFVVEDETARRVRLEYSSWIARIGTSEVNAAAIRSLQQGASMEVKRHFEIEPDGSFTIDTLALVLKAA